MSRSLGSPRLARDLFVTGPTGYLGSRLIPLLHARGHRVRALVREQSLARLPPGAEAVVGDALRRATFASTVRAGDTFVHLVGTPRPSPAKARLFREVDLLSTREAAAVAHFAGVSHFVYVSVAQPAPVMQAYVAARAAGENEIRESGLVATFLRPFYVLGPGHRWAYLLLPLFALAKAFPGWRATARRLDPVRLPQMLAALVEAIENPPAGGVRIVEAPEIRRR